MALTVVGPLCTITHPNLLYGALTLFVSTVLFCAHNVYVLKYGYKTVLLMYVSVCVCVCVYGLTAWAFADDAVCVVLAGTGLPQSCVALHPETGAGGQHAQVGILQLPVSVAQSHVLRPL